MLQTPLRPYTFAPLALVLVLSLVFLCTSIWYIVEFWSTSGDFVIISQHQGCEQPLNNRCDNVYVVERTSGEKDVIDGWVSPGDWQFQDGNHLQKKAGNFWYTVNGQLEEWPSLQLFSSQIVASICGLLFWFFLGGPRVLFLWLSHLKSQSSKNGS